MPLEITITDVNIRNPFRQKIKLHKTTEILSNMKSYFYLAKNKTKVVNYAILDGGVVATQDEITNKDLHICEICGIDLYTSSEYIEELKIDPDKDLQKDSALMRRLAKTGITPEEALDTKIAITRRSFKAKRHMVFFDTLGHGHRTCYRPQECLRKINWKASNVGSEDAKNILEYTINDIVPLDPSTDKTSPIYKKMVASFEENVKPVIEKWIICQIDKENCLEFIKDLDSLQPFLDMFEEGTAQKKIYHSICRCIGVKT